MLFAVSGFKIGNLKLRVRQTVEIGWEPHMKQARMEYYVVVVEGIVVAVSTTPPPAVSLVGLWLVFSPSGVKQE